VSTSFSCYSIAPPPLPPPPPPPPSVAVAAAAAAADVPRHHRNTHDTPDAIFVDDKFLIHEGVLAAFDQSDCQLLFQSRTGCG